MKEKCELSVNMVIAGMSLLVGTLIQFGCFGMASFVFTYFLFTVLGCLLNKRKND